MCPSTPTHLSQAPGRLTGDKRPCLKELTVSGREKGYYFIIMTLSTCSVPSPALKAEYSFNLYNYPVGMLVLYR